MALSYITEAQVADLAAIMHIINDAKAFLKASGSSQWQEGYPDEATILSDIKEHAGFILKTDGQIAAYAAITGQDPNYAVIDGAWANVADPYAAISLSDDIAAAFSHLISVFVISAPDSCPLSIFLMTR